MSKVLLLCGLFVSQCAANTPSADHGICSKSPQVASDTVSNQGKFAVWDANLKVLLYVDSPAYPEKGWIGSLVYAFDPKTGISHEVISFDKAIVGSIMPLTGGGVILAISDPVPGSSMFTSTVQTMSINAQSFKGSDLQIVTTLPSDTRGKFNNGNCDPEGRFWVGTFEYGKESENKGKVWVLRPGANGSGYSANVGIDNIGHPNGMFWRENGSQVLFSRTFINVIEQYEYSLDRGEVVGKPVDLVDARAGEALLDSMCGFQDGSFLVADPDHKVLQYFSAGGERKCNVNVPIEGSTFVASCTFVGDDLYITTGRNGGDASGKAGKLYRIEGVAGGVESNACNIKMPQTNMVLV